MKHLLTLILTCLAALELSAQGIVVTSFEEDLTSIDANIEGQTYYDQNNDQCALIKVYTTQTGFSFNFGNAVQISHREQHTAEIWLWVSPGAKFVTISHPDLGHSDRYTFPSPVVSARTYIMRLTSGRVQTVMTEDIGGNYLLFNVSPSTAQVYIDDMPRTLKSDGSVSCFLSYGTHSYRISANGYVTDAGVVDIGSGDKVVRTISLRSSLATLTVKAASTADSIFVNEDYRAMGFYMGKVDAGSYVVEAHREGHRSVRQTVTLAQEEQRTVTLQSPTPVYGQLNIDSDPSDATVYVDDKQVGSTPGVFRDILVGRSTLRLTREGYDDYTAQINIQEGKTTTVNARMKKVEQQAALTPSRSTEGSRTINGHEYVDLGLSVKWATCNVGAGSPGDYGNYYAWGVTSTESVYLGCKTLGEDYGDIGGNASTDAARTNWGGTWRLPTRAEFRELLKKCTWTWTTREGHKGYLVTGRNGNSIFLPAAGWRFGSSLYDAGTVGFYWSSTPGSNTQYACRLDFSRRLRGTDRYYRDVGQSVRPVSE